MKTVHWQTLDALSQKNLLRPHFLEKEKNTLSEIVSEIILDVKINGDTALNAYTERFDRVTLKNLKVTPEEFDATENISAVHKAAIKTAYENIKLFHTLELPKEISITHNDILIQKRYQPIQKVGLYVPGGNAPLISTVLMLGIPAMIATCPHIVLVSPPNQQGEISPYILHAAKMCGITEIYKAGGAQAIAALAYGTQTIPKVDKIFGPGNQYVTQAKIQVSQDPHGAALDMPAGPSEVLVIADEQANPAFVASDLLAQAEHDEHASALLVTPSEIFSKKVIEHIHLQKASLSRREILKKSLEKAL